MNINPILVGIDKEKSKANSEMHSFKPQLTKISKQDFDIKSMNELLQLRANQMNRNLQKSFNDNLKISTKTTKVQNELHKEFIKGRIISFLGVIVIYGLLITAPILVFSLGYITRKGFMWWIVAVILLGIFGLLWLSSKKPRPTGESQLYNVKKIKDFKFTGGDLDAGTYTGIVEDEETGISSELKDRCCNTNRPSSVFKQVTETCSKDRKSDKFYHDETLPYQIYL